MSNALNTLALDVDTWDLVIDAQGNIAMATPPYALAQDVASAIRTFLGEVYYDTTLGVPYFSQILGQFPPISLLKSLIEQAAITVPGVVTANCVVQSVVNRVVTGQVQFTDDTGNVGSVSLGPTPPSVSQFWTADSTTVTADSTFYTADG